MQNGIDRRNKIYDEFSNSIKSKKINIITENN